jgi:hypothetical protein
MRMAPLAIGTRTMALDALSWHAGGVGREEPMGRRFLLSLAAASSCLCLAGSPAKADAIDGDWCFADGRHFSIRGPRITTPAGRETQGDYSRHAFS